MKRLAVQILFVLIGLGSLGFTYVDVIANTLGDCGDDALCNGQRDIAGQLIFWRSLCGAIIIVLAYRFFRKDPDV